MHEKPNGLLAQGEEERREKIRLLKRNSWNEKRGAGKRRVATPRYTAGGL